MIGKAEVIIRGRLNMQVRGNQATSLGFVKIN